MLNRKQSQTGFKLNEAGYILGDLTSLKRIVNHK